MIAPADLTRRSIKLFHLEDTCLLITFTRPLPAFAPTSSPLTFYHPYPVVCDLLSCSRLTYISSTCCLDTCVSIISLSGTLPQCLGEYLTIFPTPTFFSQRHHLSPTRNLYFSSTTVFCATVLCKL